MEHAGNQLFASLEELADSRYTEIFELLHTGIALLSDQGVFLYANRAFMELFGFAEDIRGHHVSQLFLTSEQGVMEAIRTREMTVCSSITANNSQGVSFRYPLLDAEGNLLGIIIEAVPTNIDRDKLGNLLSTIKNLEEKANYLEHKLLKKSGMLYSFDSIVGESAVMLEMKRLGRRFAKNTEPVLLSGESGTGKELAAQALHMASPRSTGPFVAVNCAALPHELVESELFGYAGGAFTGAKSSGMKGKFELADTGTIFLDEIAELPLAVQAKLLRVLESGEIQKIGQSGTLHMDFRLIAATNRNLLSLVDEGVFREDLYHRLNILELTIPPLRERTSDIPLLVRYFVEATMGARAAQEISISNEVYRLFSCYPWRGNVRELRNVLTSALYSMEADEKVVSAQHLPGRFFKDMEDAPEEREAGWSGQKLSQASAQAERKAVLSALASAKNNKSKAAKLLGISRNNLYKKLRVLGLRSNE